MRLNKDLIKPSPYDERDYKLKADRTFPKEYHIPNPPPIYDQGPTGMCAGFAIASVLGWLHWKETGTYKRVSPSMIYAHRTSSHWQGEGMYPRQALQMVQKYGACFYDDFEVLGTYDEVQEEFLKKEKHYKALAAQQAIKTYYHLSTVEELKTALMKYGPVLVAWGIYDSLADVGSNGRVKEVIPGERFYGGHLSYVVGFNEYGPIIANSWGTGAGDKGYYNIPYNYSAVMEYWGVTDRPAFDYDTEIYLRIGDINLYIIDGLDQEIVKMDVAPFIKNSRTFVPLRFVAEALGKKVLWQESTQTVIITDNFNKEV